MRKQKKNWNMNKIMTLFLAFIMVFSIFGFVILSSLAPSSEKIKYNGYTFLATQQGYRTKVDGNYLYFAYLPGDLESVPLGNDVKAQLFGKRMIYLTSDPNSTFIQEIAVIEYEMTPILNDFVQVYTPSAFNAKNRYNLTIITCDDATASVPVIEFREGNNTGFTLDGNCIIAETDSSNGLYMIRDRLLYTMLGIIE